MADLRYADKLKLEKLFGMSSGYVLDFSNRTFQEFIFDNLNLDIYDSKYEYGSGSKANLLRGFWNAESNYNVARLNFALLEHWRTLRLSSDEDLSSNEQALYEECFRTAEQLKENAIGEHIDAIQPSSDEKDFSLLAKTIRESIERNEPEAALDRLHTYLVKFLRNICDKHNIVYDQNKPLHSLCGEYVKHLRDERLIDSPMTERILKSSISVFEAFNQVRNNQSFAHDNELLNYSESILIFKNISSTIEFMEAIEQRIEQSQESESEDDNLDDLPF